MSATVRATQPIFRNHRNNVGRKGLKGFQRISLHSLSHYRWYLSPSLPPGYLYPPGYLLLYYFSGYIFFLPSPSVSFLYYFSLHIFFLPPSPFYIISLYIYSSFPPLLSILFLSTYILSFPPSPLSFLYYFSLHIFFLPSPSPFYIISLYIYSSLPSPSPFYIISLYIYSSFPPPLLSILFLSTYILPSLPLSFLYYFSLHIFFLPSPSPFYIISLYIYSSFPPLLSILFLSTYILPSLPLSFLYYFSLHIPPPLSPSLYPPPSIVSLSTSPLLSIEGIDLDLAPVLPVFVALQVSMIHLIISHLKDIYRI